MMVNGKANGHSNGSAANIAVQWPAPIGKAGMYGIAGRFVELAAPCTEADPNAILLTFLTYAGTLLGRRFYLPAGADRHCGNLYLCLVGATAGGRKGSAISAAEQFFTAGINAPRLPQVLYGISSGEGLIWKVHDAITRREYNKQHHTFEDLPLEENIEDKRALYSLSEFQQTIINMRRPDSILSSVLRQAWDKDRLASPSKNSSATATGAHIAMVGAISKEELLKETLPVDAQNGTLNRFLFGCCRRSKLLPEGETFHCLTNQQGPEPLEGLAKAWNDLQMEFNKNIEEDELSLRIRRTPEAQKNWGLNAYPDDGGFYETLSQPRPGLWGTITARAAQQVMRLSLITAIINGRRTITDEDQDAGWEYWRYCDDSCRYIWGDTTDPTAGRILKGLRESQHGLTRTELGDLFSGHRTKDEIDLALSWLSQRGLAYSKPYGSGGRPGEQWHATL